MPARILVVGFDACDAELVERWSAEGHLPAFSDLASSARTLRLANSLETLPGAIWPELTTGRSCAKMAQFFHPEQLRSGETRLRPIEAAEVDPESFYWTVAGRYGRRVAVVDQVQTVPAKGLDGIQLLEWGLHDRTFFTQSEPPRVLEDIRRRFGDHGVAECDRHGQTPEGYARLLEDLRAGIETKTRFCEEMLARESWDLFACTYAESHCVGHQFWHFQDPSHPRFRSDQPERLREAMRTVYRALDGALSRLAVAAGRETTLFAVASHGMNQRRSGPILLPELLARLGLSGGGSSRAARFARRIFDLGRGLPPSARSTLKSFVRSTPLGAAIVPTGGSFDPFASSRTIAAVIPNNRVGAIRFNLKGREPLGALASGAAREEVTALLRREIGALLNERGGERIVERIMTAEEAFGAESHPDVPDLLIVFRTDLGLLERCYSPLLGEIHLPPTWRKKYPRTGDHTSESRLWVRGPGIAPGRGEARAIDLAPSVLAKLGVPLPAWLDGAPQAF